MSVEHLDAAKGGPLQVRIAGEHHLLADPAHLDFQTLLGVLQSEVVPGLPPCTDWQRRLVFGRWRAHYDLLEPQDAHRLTYLIDKYVGDLTFDLAHFAHADLGELWRARRWRHLLHLIDRLPSHSWYSAAVANDEEHARMLAEAMAARGEDEESESKGPTGPSLQSWTPEVAAMTQVLDAVREVAYAIVAVNGGKQKPPQAAARPHSALQAALKAASHKHRQAKHDALVAQVLPHKAK